MLKNCSLIATLPNLSRIEKVHHILENPNISGARFNTGVNSLMSPLETVSLLKRISLEYHKPIWIDIKGRQLRIVKWADPLYEAIELNHNISVVYPAKIHFRNGDSTNITRVRGNKILVDPLPKEALGAGQSVNIIAKDLEITGYLTDLDKQYLKACAQNNMNHIMASYVEEMADLNEIKEYLPKAEITAKIESLKGMKLILESNIDYDLMAARDDLYIETGQNANIISYLKVIVERNYNAICASRIFSSLERQNYVELADYTDLLMMYEMGYRRFMLCDNICNYHFDEAVKNWKVLTK